MLYSLCHSPRHWYTKINSVLNKIGLKPNSSDPCLFMGHIVDPSHPEFPCSTLPITLGLLGWGIRLEFRGIQRLSRFRTFWTPEFSLEFIFPIVKCVPANSEHVSSGSESSSAIDSSNFINQKTFPPSVFFWPAKKVSSSISQRVNLIMHSCVDVGTIPSKDIVLTNIYH